MTQPRVPGCFGIPSIFSQTSKVCGVCPQSEPCKGRVVEALVSMPRSQKVKGLLASFGVEPKEPTKPKRKALTSEQQEVVASLPKKAGDYLRTLYSRGRDVVIREAAKLGENPFNTFNARPWSAAFNALMRGGVSKAALKMEFVCELKWSESAAKSQVSIIWSVFKALGIAVEDHKGILKPHPSMHCDNSQVVNQEV